MLANAMNVKAIRAQIQRIFGEAKKLGLDNDALHDKVKAVTGLEHISQLTMSQADDVIDSLTGKRRSFQPVTHVQRPISRASQEQISLIFGLAKKLGWLEGGDKKRLIGFIRGQYGVECIDWMEPDDAIKCIEALKAMVAGGRKERKGYHGEA
jgi:hypothetical protein